MSMRGVLAQTSVRDDEHVRGSAFHCARGLLHDAVFGICARRGFIFSFRQTEKNDALDSQLKSSNGIADCFVNREIENSGHGRDFAAHFRAWTEEQREDEIFWRKPHLAHQGSQRLASSQSSRSSNYVGHLLDLLFKTISSMMIRIANPACKRFISPQLDLSSRA